MINKCNFSDTYSLNNAIFMAYLSNEIYEHTKLNIEEVYKKKYGFDEAHFFSKKHKSIDLQFCVLKKAEHTVVVFKGSQEKEDWLTNFRVKKKEFKGTKTYVHEGFMESFELFEKLELSALVKEFNENKSHTLSVTGHSLGGAIATIFTAYLLNINIDKERYVCYTFGAPPIGCKNFCMQHKKVNLYRVVNSNDPVPAVNRLKIPFLNLRYLEHIGELKELKAEIFEHHLMSHYIDNLQELL